jgi:hypothetical protein
LLEWIGEIFKRAVSDRFGYYRIDGLPPATYGLTLADEERPGEGIWEMPRREVIVVDDFLFGQDLTVLAR